MLCCREIWPERTWQSEAPSLVREGSQRGWSYWREAAISSGGCLRANRLRAILDLRRPFIILPWERPWRGKATSRGRSGATANRLRSSAPWHLNQPTVRPSSIWRRCMSKKAPCWRAWDKSNQRGPSMSKPFLWCAPLLPTRGTRKRPTPWPMRLPALGIYACWKLPAESSQERISRMQRAQGYYGESLENRKRIGHDAALSPDGFVCGNAREAARSLAACNAALGNLQTNNRPLAKNF